MIYIGADHGGYKLKEFLKQYLNKQKIAFVDLGAKTLKPGDDYPDFAKLVAAKVKLNPKINSGILICRSGQGVCIVANKFKGVRAALVWNTKEAKMSRTDDMTNVLCLPADYVSKSVAENIVGVWLATNYSKDKRHIRRIQKISKLEK
jgi:ribose 5-phosphate isomerase B